MTERTDTEQGHAPDGDGHLEAEHELDQAALARALPVEDRPPAPGPPEGDQAPTETPTPAAAGAALGPPPAGGLRRRTRILLGVLAGGLIFLSGIQCQKLTAGQPGPPGAGQTTPEEATDTPAQPSGTAPRVVQGEIVALRGSVLYVREADGDTVRMEAGGASRVFRGVPSDLATVRPGEIVVAELQPGEEEPAAISLTVLPPRERGP